MRMRADCIAVEQIFWESKNDAVAICASEVDYGVRALALLEE
jgi:hypothetical protein